MKLSHNPRLLPFTSRQDVLRELQSLGMDVETAPGLGSQVMYHYLRMENVDVSTVKFLHEAMSSLGGRLFSPALREGMRKKEYVDVLVVGTEEMLRALLAHVKCYPSVSSQLAEALSTCLGDPGKEALALEVGGRMIDFSSRTYIMGVLNVTPDSFSDGGRFFDHEKAVRHALTMAEDGADIIDVGGESTRPGAHTITPQDELGRVIPVIKAIKKETTALLSIDTTKARVAEEALEAGADMVNDVSAVRFDPKMPEVLARWQVPVVLMHMRGNPRTMQGDVYYENLMGVIVGFLGERIAFAVSSGVKKEKIIVDPGIGFGKSIDTHNYFILRNLEELKSLGRPVMVGPSRKAFLGHLLKVPPDDREEATAAAVAIAAVHGANIVRVHDVKKMKRVVRVADAIRNAVPA